MDVDYLTNYGVWVWDFHNLLKWVCVLSIYYKNKRVKTSDCQIPNILYSDAVKMHCFRCRIYTEMHFTNSRRCHFSINSILSTHVCSSDLICFHSCYFAKCETQKPQANFWNICCTQRYR